MVSGKTKRKHLEAVEAQTGKTPKLLQIALPIDAAYLWDWFRQIHSLGGVVDLQSLDQWSRLFNIKLIESEIIILSNLETLRLKASDS